MNAELHLLGAEIGKKMARDFRGKKFRQQDAHAQHRGHHGDDDRESFLRFVFLVLREKTGVDRNEGDGSGAARHQIIQPVGNGEAGDVGVGCGPGAEGIRDIGLAHIPDHARQHDRRHEQQRGRKRSVLMGRAKEANQAGEAANRARFRRLSRIRHQGAILHANIPPA